MISRRSFLTLASGLLVPEPTTVYSFAGGWKLPRWYPVLYGGLPLVTWNGRPFGGKGLGPIVVPDGDLVRFDFDTASHAYVEPYFRRLNAGR